MNQCHAQPTAKLKNCFSIPRLQYILQTSPTFFCQDELIRFDGKVRDELQAVLNLIYKIVLGHKSLYL